METSLSNNSKLSGLASVAFNGKSYYYSINVFELAPTWFRKCKVSGTWRQRQVINQKLAKVGSYHFFRQDAKTKQWTPSDGTSNKVDKLFLTKEYLLKIPEIIGDETPIVDASGIELAPDVLQLEEREMFKDTAGNIVEVEVRGERDRKKCFFRVEDVARAFELPEFDHTLRRDRGYQEDLHYKYFMVKKGVNDPFCVNNNSGMQKGLFLTWSGLLKVIYSSRAGTAERYREWADEILFVAQMGTHIDRSMLADRIHYNVFTWSGLYLIKIAPVSGVRHKVAFADHIGDDACIYKFGRGEDIAKRFVAHVNDPVYADLGHELQIVHACFIPEVFLVEAERLLRERVYPSYGQQHRGKLELITLNNNQLNEVKKIYQELHANYTGQMSDKSEYINNLHRDIWSLQVEKAEAEANLQVEKAKAEANLQVEKAKAEANLQVEKAKTDTTHAQHISELKDNVRVMEIELAELQQRSAYQTDLIKELRGRLEDKDCIISCLKKQ
jgi:prophage antirepressor-like protein